MVIQFKNSQNFTRPVRFRGWDALQVERGDAALVFAPQIGGRILGCAYKGRELFFTHPAFEGAVVPRPATVEALKRAKAEAGLRLYGGCKTWLSPQASWPEALPFFDLDSTAWEWSQCSSRGETVISMRSPACRESGARLSKEVRLGASNEVRVRQTLENASDRPMRHGLWDVTQLSRPGIVYAPVKRLSGFERGVKLFAEETPDRERAMRKLDILGGAARIDCDDATRFKFGVDSEEGWLVGFFPWEKGRWIVFKQAFAITPGAVWGHGCAAEVFNSDETDNLEMEVHGPLVSLAPGESFEWSSAWRVSECSAPPQTAEELASFAGPLGVK